MSPQVSGYYSRQKVLWFGLIALLVMLLYTLSRGGNAAESSQTDIPPYSEFIFIGAILGFNMVPLIGLGLISKKSKFSYTFEVSAALYYIVMGSIHHGVYFPTDALAGVALITGPIFVTLGLIGIHFLDNLLHYILSLYKK